MKLLRQILTFFCIIFLFVAIVFTIIIYSGKNLLNKENLSNYIKNSNILNMDINVIFNLEESGMTLKEKIYNLGLECNIPDKIVDDILKSEEINLILGDFFNETIYYLIDERTKPELSDEAVNKMVDLALLSLEDNINIMLTKEELNEYILDYADKLTSIIPDRQVMIGVLPISTINSILNFNIVYLYLIMFILLVLIVLFSWSFYKSIKYLGISMLVSGLIFVILGCMNSFLNELILTQIERLKLLVSPFITILLTIWFKCGVLISFSGVFLILIYVVINRIIINSYETK